LASVFLRASTDFSTMVECVQESIQKLQFEYERSGSGTIVEFEVKGPVYFRVVTEKNPSPDERALLIPALDRPEGTTLQVRFGVNASEEEQASGMPYVDRFIKTLAECLPASPWSGMGLRGSHREKKRWNQLIKRAGQG